MDATLTALAQPSRLQIVDLLLRGPRSVAEIVERLELRQPQVSKHLRVLNDAGVVDVRPVAQQRIYSLRPEAFMELDAWLASYRRLWDERLDRFDEVLQDLKQQQIDNDKEKEHDRDN
ncbi:MAG: metalloregulator ArsR/SmtB family transcription factor [Candidatus Dormibacteraeota bacterium]|nr:metalloregulator ArsR/SmtB family transcription factor [Candidatus Dormibacteraeota bacterium]